MMILTTNSLAMKALRTLCCAGALVTSPIWASVVDWKLDRGSAASDIGPSRAFSESANATAAWGINNIALIDPSHQFSFKSTVEAEASKNTSTGLSSALNNSLQAGDMDNQGGASILSRGQTHSALRSNQPMESLSVASSTAPSRAATELDEAMARTSFNEEFVSVPTIQFASLATTGPAAVSVISTANVGVVPVPEMSAFFPIVGLIVAVSCTQILRRRRAAQQGTFRHLV